MARAIQTYERQFLPSGVQGAATGSMAVPTHSYMGEAMQNAGNTGMAIGRQLQEEQNKQIEDRSAVDVANVLSKGDVYWQEDFTKRAQAWKPGDPDIRDGLGKDFDKWQGESAQALQTPAARNYFLKQTAANKARLLENAFSYQQKTTTDKLNADTEVGQKADEDILAQDPARFDEVYKRRMETVIPRNDLTEGDKIRKGDQLRRRYSYAVERGEMERDPVGWYTKRFGAFKREPELGADGKPLVAKTNAVEDQLWAAQINQESGGKQFKDGKPLTSSAGAIGVAQVMPDTGPEAAKLAGLPWDIRRFHEDAGYNEALGRAYMDKQLQTFGGDVNKALAAYNMGPGSTSKGNGVAGLVSKYGEDWLSHAPQETQDYVKRITSRMGGPGRPAPSIQLAQADTGTASDAGNGMPAITPVEQPSTFTGMDWDQQLAMKSAAETKMRQMEAQAQSTMDATLRDAMSMHADGKQDPFNLTPAAFDLAYGQQGRAKYQDYLASRQMGQDIGQYQTMTPDEIRANLEGAKAGVDAMAQSGGVGYEMADKRLQGRVAAAQQVVKRQQDDPQAYAAQVGLSSAQPIDMQDPAKMGAELSKRVSTAQMMSQKYRAPYKILTNQEADQMAGVMRKFPAEARVSYLESMRASVQDPTAYRTLMQQVAPDSPVTAVAGSILAQQAYVQPGGWFSSDVSFSPKAVATTILQGESILNPNTDAKKGDGRGGNFPMPKDQAMETEFGDFVGTSFRGDPAGYSAAYQAYRAYYAGKASEKGILSQDLDSSISKEAMTAVTGGVMDFNGHGQVLKPWGWSDQNFKNTIASQFDAQMAAAGLKGTPADNLSAYGLQSIRQNQYLLTNGVSYLLGKNGQPVLLDLTTTNPSQRIPGAVQK